MKNVYFYLGIGILFTHELDAMSNFEWKMIPLLRSLPEMAGMNVFLLLHVPLFAILIGLIASKNERLRRLSRIIVSIFLLIHAGLHILFSSDVNYTFTSTISNALIYGGALFGGLYLTTSFRDIHQ